MQQDHLLELPKLMFPRHEESKCALEIVTYSLKNKNYTNLQHLMVKELILHSRKCYFKYKSLCKNVVIAAD